MLLMVRLVVMAPTLAQNTVSCATRTTNVCLAAGCLKYVIDNATLVI
jgi:hypothetical protein